MTSSSTFSSPVGPIHFATPASSSALLRVPFLSKFRSSKNRKSLNQSPAITSTTTASYRENGPTTVGCSQRGAASPPSYHQVTATAKDQKGTDKITYENNKKSRLAEVEVENRMRAWDEQRRREERERVKRQDRVMGESLASIGL